MSTNKDSYDKLVQKSVINDNYALKSHDELRNNIFIPCNFIDIFYNDSLFYLHFHSALYIELLKYNIDNRFDITKFQTLINNLKIEFDNISTVSSEVRVTGIQVNNRGNYQTSSTISITDSKNIFNYTPIINTGIRSDFLISGGTGFQSGDIITFTLPDNGISAKITVNSVTTPSGEISKIDIENRGNGYTTSSITIDNILSVTRKNLSISPSKVNLTITNGEIVKYIDTVSISTPKFQNKVFKSDELGTILISGGTPVSGLSSASSASLNYIMDQNPIGVLDASFKFTFRTNNLPYNLTTQYFTDDTAYNNLLVNKTPILDNISSISSTFDTTTMIDSSTKEDVGGTSLQYSKTSLNAYIIKNNPDANYSNDERKNKFNKVLKILFNNSASNILSYLNYTIRYYNIIVFNTSIQRIIYEKYLNNNSINMSIQDVFITNDDAKNKLNNIITHINNMKNNIITLKDNTSKDNNIFVNSKDDYIDRIRLLNESTNEYNNNQDSLNNIIKNYNSYFYNYNKIKIYANSIIIFLIILIIFTIIVTFLPYFNINSKNTYYTLILLLLLILTYIFYNKFSYINLYENFDCNSQKNSYKTDYTSGEINNNNKLNNTYFFNKLYEAINEYNKIYKQYSDNMGSAIFTSDNKVFEEDGNNYLNSLYIEKNRKIDLFRIKRINLINLIETIKKEIIYLFNIIVIFCLTIIVLLIALLIYTNIPNSIIFIIIFIIIALLLIFYYFTIAIVQPTRLIANKNYWSNKNPSKETINKL